MLTYPKPSQESAGSGFVPVWGVATKYEVKRGVLREEGAPVRAYNPFAAVELPTALARITSNELSPVAFASEFGLLGYDKLAPEKPRGGDPLDWIIAHSRTVALFLELIGLLEEGDYAGLDYVLPEASTGPYAWGATLVGLPTDVIRHELRRGIPAAAIARNYLSRYITENVVGVTRLLNTDAQRTRLASLFTFRGMIEAVYWQLADRAESGGVRRCRQCRHFFVARDKRQQYCPPFPGATRSRCSSKFNVQNFRSRERST
jgi:hypothetical protein